MCYFESFLHGSGKCSGCCLISHLWKADSELLVKFGLSLMGKPHSLLTSGLAIYLYRFRVKCIKWYLTAPIFQREEVATKSKNYKSSFHPNYPLFSPQKTL
jgi:hypothetical protein